MNDNHGAKLWMTVAFGVALILAVVVFAIMGTDEKGTVAALRVSARLSFLLFWPAYAGSALATLFGSIFESLARHGRDFGLAFAAALSVHLGLVVWFYHVSGRQFHPTPYIIVELIGVAWIYVLACFSIKRLHDAINPGVWRQMRTLGMEYIAVVFACNFAVFPTSITYFPFLLLLIMGIIIRSVVALRYWKSSNMAASS